MAVAMTGFFRFFEVFEQKGANANDDQQAQH